MKDKLLRIIYSTFQQVSTKIPLYYIVQGDGSYIVCGIGDSLSFLCHIDNSNDIIDFETNIKSLATEVPAIDDAIALGTLKNNYPLVIPYQSDKATLVAVVGREGSETIQATHDFTKKESWYVNSVRVTDEVLSDSGDGLTFSGSHQFWIDMDHGKVYDEESLKEDVSHEYAVNIIVTGSVLVGKIPFESFEGEYTVNYRSGTVTFASPPPGPVTASYSYATDSIWVLKPYPSKSIDVEEAEIQFSSDIVMTDSVMMEAWGWVQIFAPQYWQGNGGPFPTNYLVRLEQTEYKSFYQIVDEALGSYPVLPQIDGLNGRGTSAPIYGFPFRYGAVRRIHSKYGMEIRVYLKNNTEYSGSRATATFYCISRNETDLE